MKMIDYSKMSDFEINCEIARLMGYTAKGFIHDLHSGVWNPCNNPADAWPIVVGNDISLECVIVNKHQKTWRALFKPSYVKHKVNDKNPLRAAMIVFLMMQEDKK